MDGSAHEAGRRTLTPAVIASAVFAVACAAIAVAFVAARGGLELPVAPAASHSAVSTRGASPSPTAAPIQTPSATTVTVVSTPAQTGSPAASPAAATPTPASTSQPTPDGTPDALAALRACPGHPDCYEYTVKRGDTLSGVASRYGIPLSTVRALNPALDAAGTIVVGRTLYLGRQPYLRLDRCADAVDCYLYVVQPGDGLSTIAARFGLTVQAILDANPEIPNENTSTRAGSSASSTRRPSSSH